jgi:hypothetical protein
MKIRCFTSSASCLLPFLLAATVFQAGSTRSEAQGYRAGDVITTNFSFGNRYLWTNDNHQVFTPSNTVIRLSDFDGKILFLDFFDVW